MKTIGILGGSGMVGRALAALLLRNEDVRVVLLGRNAEKLTLAAAALPQSERVRTAQADAADPASLRTAFADLDLAIVTAPLLNALEGVVGAALDTGTDWLDVMLDSPQKWQVFDALAQRFIDEGRIGLVSAGVHPGLPAVLIRAAAQHHAISSAEVGMVLDMDWSAGFSPETAREFTLEMANMRAGRLVDGEWKQYSWLNPKSVTKVDFGPIGRRACAYMELEEIRRLPEVLPGVRNAELAVSGFSPLVDYLLMPVALVLVAASKRLVDPAAKLLAWGLRRSVKPPYRVVLQLRAEADGATFLSSVSHPDPYWLTSAVAAATAMQILDGSIHVGVRPAALGVDPSRLLVDLAKLGATVEGN